jgi:hypothetical protein
MNSLAQFAGAHPEGLTAVIEIFATLAGGLVIGGLIALGGAIAGLIGVGGIITCLVVSFTALAAFNWDSIAGIGMPS